MPYSIRVPAILFATLLVALTLVPSVSSLTSVHPPEVRIDMM
jgi:hypothetical protein